MQGREIAPLRSLSMALQRAPADMPFALSSAMHVSGRKVEVNTCHKMHQTRHASALMGEHNHDAHNGPPQAVTPDDIVCGPHQGR